MHVAPGERVYVFTSIFAPGGLNTNIVHHWQFFNPNTGGWVDWSAPSFGVSGGRGDGYRGFSFSGNLQPGKWRVNVTTEHGQILGRVHFRVESVDEPVSLEERTK